jgi:hypothetical protein
MRTDLPKCKCGCGQYVVWLKSKKRWATWIRGHHGKGIPRPQYVRDVLSVARKGKPGTAHTNEFIAKLSANRKGKNNPCWRGGASFYPYDARYTKELKQEIKDRDGNKCVNPGCKTGDLFLHVHHVDYNKKKYSQDKSSVVMSKLPFTYKWK